MLTIQDKLSVSLKIDGDEVEYGGLVTVIATEGNGVFVPALKIIMADPTSALSSQDVLTEGNEIELSIAKTFKDNAVRPRLYRVFAVKRGNNPLNPLVEIVAIINSPDYISKSARESYSGTSESVMQQVAAKCGMSFSGQSSLDGRTPNDSQKWLNVCSNRAKFVADVVRHGWIDQHSGMASAVTSYNELRYRDLIALINTPLDKIGFVFSHSTIPNSGDDAKKSYLVREARDSSTAGVMASWQNYGSTRAQNMLSGEHEISKELEVKMPGSYLPVNKKVGDQIDKSRIEYAPLDCGNVHKKYEIAKYQNIKLKALFSEKMSLMVYDVTEVQLFDVVIYRQEDADLKQPIKNTDVYLVVGKTLVVSGGVHYAERIELARMSLTMKGNTDLEAPSGAASERSMIPDVSINSGQMGVIAAANRLNVSSLASALNSVNSGNSIIDGLKSTLLAPITSSLSVVDDVYNKVQQGLASPQSVTDLLRSTVSLASAAATLKNAVTYMSSANGGLLSALTNSAQSVKSQMISQANSVTTSLVNQYAIAMPLQAATKAVSSTLGVMPKDVLNAASDYRELQSVLAEATSSVASLTGNVNGQWNSTLASVRGLAVPSTFSSGVPQVGVNLQQGLSVNNLSDVNLLSVVHEGMRRDYSGQPGWIGPQGMSLGIPTDTFKQTFDSASAFAKRLSSNVNA